MTSLLTSSSAQSLPNGIMAVHDATCVRPFEGKAIDCASDIGFHLQVRLGESSQYRRILRRAHSGHPVVDCDGFGQGHEGVPRQSSRYESGHRHNREECLAQQLGTEQGPRLDTCRNKIRRASTQNAPDGARQPCQRHVAGSRCLRPCCSEIYRAP